jgi:hypothetical protein
MQKMAASSVAIELVNNIKSRILTPEESPEDFEKFAQSRMRKEQRHEKKAQERFEKRQSRRLATSTPAPPSAPQKGSATPVQKASTITPSEIGSYLKPS